MKIGIIGTRGIPNAYGGFEQFAQYLSEGLTRKGHEVWVYNSHRHPYQLPEWKDVHIIHCKDWEHRIGTAGQFLYDRNCFTDARKRNFDILLQLGYTSSSIWHRSWPDTVNVVNMDGLEWMRTKYSKPVQRFLRWAEKLAVQHADVLVADSPAIREYLNTTYNKQAAYIAYGATIPEGFDVSHLAAYGLKPGGYYMILARMEPENHIEMVIRGYLLSGQRLPLVVIGNINNTYGKELQKKYTEVRFMPGIYETGIVNALRHFSRLYFHGHSVGGTNPSLLEAMACGCTIAAHNNPFNKTVLEDNAYYFSSAEDVSGIVNTTNDAAINGMIEANQQKIQEHYSWSSIIDSHESLFLRSLQKKD